LRFSWNRYDNFLHLYIVSDRKFGSRGGCLFQNKYILLTSLYLHNYPKTILREEGISNEQRKQKDRFKS
jgi:hypothetical protein